MFLFLEELSAVSSAGSMGPLLVLIAGMLLAAFLIGIAVWIFTSFAYMSIAKKAKYSPAGLAWIPVIGPAIVTSQIAKMHWWPILLLVVFWIPIIGTLAALVFWVFSIIWLWKTFEAVKRPGWWAIVSIIPVVNLVLLGIAAWSKK